jgi:hypothetical protein
MTRLPLRGPVGSARSMLSLAVALAAVGVAACGPSFQTVYEGELNFEHCYALDQSNVSNDARKECWREWLHGYTYGQSNDRVEYAATRFSELSLDESLPSEDVKDGGARGHRVRRPESTVAAPVPTNAFAPPPNTSGGEGHDGREPRDSTPLRQAAAVPAIGPSDAGAAGAPGAECVSACGERLDTCRVGCKDGACAVCEKTYRTCMPACFREDAGVARGAAVH